VLWPCSRGRNRCPLCSFRGNGGAEQVCCAVPADVRVGVAILSGDEHADDFLVGHRGGEVVGRDHDGRTVFRPAQRCAERLA
jgi:hypothetical protein